MSALNWRLNIMTEVCKLLLLSKPVNVQKKPKIYQGKNKQSEKTLFYDLETTGFAANADILQESITEHILSFM